MSEEFGSDFISISDEDGKEYELEHLDTVEMDGAYYLAFAPTDVPEDSEEYGMIILKSEHGEDGNDYLVEPEDGERDRAYDKFMERLFPEDADGAVPGEDEEDSGGEADDGGK